MDKHQKYIDGLVDRILNEEINKIASSKSEILSEELKGGQKKLDVAEPKGKLTAADFKKLGSKKEVDEKWDSEVDVKKTGEYSDMSIEEINSAIKKLKAQNEKLKDAGKSVPEKNKTKMSQLYFAKRAKQGWKGKGKAAVDENETDEGNAFTGALASAKKSGKDSFEVDGKKYNVKENTKNKLSLTEDELIDLIEKIVIEEQEKNETNITKKTPVGLKQTEKVLDKNKTENDESVKNTVKKMKEYLKNASKGEYKENPDEFPKGNGELGDMKKKAYKASEAVEEYIESFAYPGMENNHYDEIKPNDEWLEKNIEGSSVTGNNPEWANAVKTDLGKKVNDKRKKNLYDKEKQRSYRRVTQPVDSAGESAGESSLDKMFTKLESTDEKKEKLISEEMKKMKNMIKYNSKTQ